MNSTSLLKVLTEAGIGSRRRLADAIRQGTVTVNGEVVTGFSYTVNRNTDRITVDGQRVHLESEPLVYLLLNKPPGVMSTTGDTRAHRTVLDLIPTQHRHFRLYPVGRLDKDSTGLLLLTNDGKLTHHLTHPRFEHEKEYLVHIAERLTPEAKRKLEKGVELEDGRTHPTAVREIKSSPPFNYSLVIHEGKKRQVRRMFGAVGHPVLALKRVRIGNLSLGNLKEGKIRELSAQEIRRLRQ
ncbi:pseudouridine synthase [Chloroflexota bacterium]